MGEVINQCYNLYIEIRPSNIVKGQVGIFAIRDIPKNTILFYNNISPQNVNILEIQKLYDFKISENVIHILKKYYAHDNETIELPNELILSYTNYLNHSETPNIIYNADDKSYQTSINIQKDDEILINYNDNYCPSCIDFNILN